MIKLDNEVLNVHETYKQSNIIVSYFRTKASEVIKTIFYSGENKDKIIIHFTNENNISNEECIEALLRGVCFQLNDKRKYLIRRTDNKELEIYINYKELENSNKFTDVIINSRINELGYNQLKRQDIQEGSDTRYEQEKLKKEKPIGVKLYEGQRDNYIEWDEYFMASAALTALRSKDPSTQVGCCIVNDDNIKLSEGYNGTPMGWNDSTFPWNRQGEYHETKYPFVVHSEANAITHCIGQGMTLHGARIYVTLFPCNECAKLIVQSGIKEVIYLSDKYAETDSIKASKRIFDECGIKYRELNPEKEITLKLKL